jgi:hypothetical protein
MRYLLDIPLSSKPVSILACKLFSPSNNWALNIGFYLRKDSLEVSNLMMWGLERRDRCDFSDGCGRMLNLQTVERETSKVQEL